MSKDKMPEVGDVWKEKDLKVKYIFLDVMEHGSYVFIEYSKKTHDVGFIEKEDYCDLIYLGKSKANIDDLFKTENEE